MTIVHHLRFRADDLAEHATAFLTDLEQVDATADAEIRAWRRRRGARC